LLLLLAFLPAVLGVPSVFGIPDVVGVPIVGCITADAGLSLLNGMNGLERNYNHFSMKCSKRNFQLFPFAEWIGMEFRAIFT
jgi:hypothetical protein